MSSQRRQHGFLLTQGDVPALDYADIRCALETICTIVAKTAEEYGVKNGCFSYPVNTSTYLTVCLKDGATLLGIYNGVYVSLEGKAKDLHPIQQKSVFFNLSAQFRRSIMQTEKEKVSRKSIFMTSLYHSWDDVIAQRVTINIPSEQKEAHLAERTITISSLHLSEETKSWLREAYEVEDDRISVYFKNNSEFLVYVPDNTASFPPNLRECLSFAKRNECKMLRFDNNGPVISELNTYPCEESRNQQKATSWR